MINHSDQLIESHVLGYFKIISLNLELSYHQVNRCDDNALKISFKLLLSPLSTKINGKWTESGHKEFETFLCCTSHSTGNKTSCWAVFFELYLGIKYMLTIL